MKGISAKGLSSMSPEVDLPIHLACGGVLPAIYPTDHVGAKAPLTREVHVG